jgi:hypothetical protein
MLACPGRGEAQITTDALLDSLQRTAFDFFWNEANPTNGLIRDRSQPWSPCSIASLGFGLSAICIGIDHGWVTHAAGRDRILSALETLWNTPQGSAASGFIGYQGLYYHFLEMDTALRTWDSELSTIDSALLFAGVIDAKEYFSTGDPLDDPVVALCDSIYYRANWEFTRNFNPGIMMGWKPGTGFATFGQWIGYNEAMILYILALGSPTHPVPASTWATWTSGYSWQTQYSYSYVNFPPLFGHQYSHCWVDFRSIRDAYMDTQGITYFENSRRATLAAREYCIANPGGFVGYGQDLWGLTASDGPFGYIAHGAPPPLNDDGTITPTAATSSIAFVPEVAIPAIRNMYESYPQLWGPYGFRDAFNLTLNWWDTDYIGIDQGPIIIMIENFRNQSVWKRFMRNADVQRGLERAGFTIATNAGPGSRTGPNDFVLSQNVPNPARGWTHIPFRLSAPGHVSLAVFDVSGRRVRRVLDGTWSAGPHEVLFDAQALASGVYIYRMEYEGNRLQKRFIVIR